MEVPASPLLTTIVDSSPFPLYGSSSPGSLGLFVGFGLHPGLSPPLSEIPPLAPSDLGGHGLFLYGGPFFCRLTHGVTPPSPCTGPPPRFRGVTMHDSSSFAGTIFHHRPHRRGRSVSLPCSSDFLFDHSSKHPDPLARGRFIHCGEQSS